MLIRAKNQHIVVQPGKHRSMEKNYMTAIGTLSHILRRGLSVYGLRVHR